jgi:hypothetical protein
MANEFKHKDPGAELTQAEFIAACGDGHIFACQATGDIAYASSATVLSKLAKGTANMVLHMGGSCIPAWTATPTLNSLTVDDVAVDGKVVTMTGSACDTIVMTAAANGAFSLVTTDTAAAAANIVITADGTVEIDSAGNLTLDSAADVEINADGGCVNFKDGSLALAAIVNTSCVGELRIHEAANYIGFKAPALSANQIWTLPAAVACCADDVLTCNGSGVLSWATAGGTTINNATANELVTIGGTTTELCAEANLTFDGTDLTVGTGNVVIATAGKGIDFAASTNAGGRTDVCTGSEVLADYEEGTWEPNLSDTTSEVTENQGYNTRAGTYTRIGNVVSISGHLDVSSIGCLSGGANIVGLPFTARPSSAPGTMFFSKAKSLGVATAGYNLSGDIPANTSYISIQVWDAAAGTTDLSVAEYSAGGEVQFGGVYHTAS